MRVGICVFMLLLVALVGGAGADEPPAGVAPGNPLDEPPKTPEDGQDPSAASGPRVLELSLTDAVRMGVGANLELHASSFDTPIADQGRIAAEGAFDTLLTAGFQVSHTETQSTNVFASPISILNNVQAHVGVSRRLRSGGSVAFLYRADRISTNNPFATVDPGYAGGVSLEATQPLLRGAGDIALADIRRAQSNVHAARAGYATQVEATLLRIVESYWELVFADANLDAQRKSEEVARELLDDANSRLAAEVGTPLDVAEARAGVERRVSEVLRAENLRATIQDRLLGLIMPFAAGSRRAVRVVPTDSPKVDANRLPSAGQERYYVQVALRGRPELRASKAEITTRGIDAKVARDAIRPQLDLLGRVASDGLDTAFDGSVAEILRGDAVSGQIGLEFSLFIGQRSARAGWLLAAWARRQAVLRMKELENQIIVEVRGALRDLDTARGQLAAGRSEVAAAQEALDGERLRLDQGKSTPFRILQKEEDLTAARTRLARASADLRIAEGRLWKAVGALARNLGVNAQRWSPCRPRCR